MSIFITEPMCDPVGGKGETILSQYLSYHNAYKQQYGDKTVVLCQVGDFFEMYAVINSQEERGPNIYRVADLLGIQVTRRNKSNTVVNDANHLMSGFPLSAIQRHAQTLVSNLYTVVIVRQVSPPPNVVRGVTEVLSSSMTLSPSTPDQNYLLVLMASVQGGAWSCGISAVDVSTGATLVFEASSTQHDRTHALDEVVRILHTCPSQEMVVLSHALPEEDRQQLEEVIGFGRGTMSIHALWDSFPDSFQKREYQEAILTKAGMGRGILSALTLSGIHGMELASIAMCYMIQFAYEHNPHLVARLQPPRHMSSENRLVLQHNSARQLNILGTGMPNEMPLLTILNRTVTSFGRRLFRDRLLHPITNREVLAERYDQVGHYLKNGLYVEVRRHLSGILDMERMLRRMMAERFAPCDWGSLHTSLVGALSACEVVPGSSITATIRSIMEGYESMLDLEEASKHQIQDIRGNIFRRGIHPELDDISDTIQRSMDDLLLLAKTLSNGEDTRACRVDCNDRDGYFLTTTRKRWGTIQQAPPPGLDMATFGTKQISHGSNTLRITSHRIERASNTILRSQAHMVSLTQKLYLAFLSSFVDAHAANIQQVVGELADMDVHSTNACNACEFAYTRPEFSAEQHSMVEARELRHPIIERIHRRVGYVANDIVLDGERPGLLLYGVNASGKSSLMKAIGLAVIMAQSGMFVPCSRLLLSPYRSIFTRISGDDNLYQGMSSFAVEMTELRSMLVRADAYSLVLGDEICSGTEAVSAVSIVASGVEMLVRNQTTFVFATHLHELLDIPEVVKHQQEGRLQIKHMHTEVINGSIVYDRTLRDGPGESTYGIEVCRGLGMPRDFMVLAERVRRRVMNEDDSFVSQKQSRYSSSVRMDMCSVCGVQRATETHHIQHQKDADENGFIDGKYTHKNLPSNLAPLCSACHDREHHGTLRIRGWVQTSHGVELDHQEEEASPTASTPTSNKATHLLEEMVHVWRPYLRYTRGGWVLRKKNTLRSRFVPVPLEDLPKAMRGIAGIPSCLVPEPADIERLQEPLLDISL